jgi:formylglycine-generating enzyme required for sulfatase activity
MQRTCVVGVVVLCLAVVGLTQEVSLSGNVTAGGIGIGGAAVSAKNHPHLAAYTKASGAFTITGPLAVINRSNHGGIAALPSIKNNTLVFNAAAPDQAIKIEVYTPNGALISNTRLHAQRIGAMRFPLNADVSGLRLIRLTVGDETYVMKMMCGVGMRTVSTRPVSSNARSSSLLGKSATGFVDTLIVTARGFRHNLSGITALNQQNIQVTLTASNPWKPSGALSRDKGMVKVLAKGYDFEMGQPDAIAGIDSGATELMISEKPVHTVSFTTDFWMDTTEVTQQEYNATMKSGYADYTTSMNWDVLYGKGERYPAYYLYWGNAVLYCNARSKNEKLDTVYRYSGINAPTGELCELFDVSADLSKNGYRLPTEAEWEYACRGGAATDFYWGKNYGPYPATAADTAEILSYAIWRLNSWDFGEGTAGFGAHQVATTKPNAYGLYDMPGNVSEHIHDFESREYSYGAAVDPAGPATGEIHLLRGGNWGNDAVNLRSASRNMSFANYPFFFVGFRTVRPVH